MKLPQRFLASREQNRFILSAPKQAARKMKESPSWAAPAPSQAWCFGLPARSGILPGATRRDQAVQLWRGIFPSALFGNFTGHLNETA